MSSQCSLVNWLEDSLENNPSNVPIIQHDSVSNDDPNLDFIPGSYAIDSLNDALIMLKSESLFCDLFTNDEWIWLEKLRVLSDVPKSMLIRLYGRSQKIFRRSDLNKLIGVRVTDEYINNLESIGFLSDDLQNISTELLLHSLTRQELGQLAAMYNIKNYKCLPMAKLIEDLNSKTTTSPISSFFKTKISHKDNLKRLITKVLGKVWILESSRTQIISRLIWLTSLGSDSGFSGPNRARSLDAQLKTELYTMSLVRKRDLIYPSYELNRKSVIYRSTQELQNCLDLIESGLKLENFIQQKLFVEGIEFFNGMKSNLYNLICSESERRPDLPKFLRRFTCPYRALRVLLKALDLLEREKKYCDAVSVIQFLLTIPSYVIINENCVLDQIGPCHCGRLLNRLIVNQCSHQKQFVEAFKFIHKFITVNNNCTCLRAGFRLTIHEQINKLWESIQSNILVNNTINSNNNNNCNSTDTKESADLCNPKPSKIRRKSSTSRFSNQNLIEALPGPPVLVTELKKAQKVQISAPINASSKEIGAHRPHYVWFELDNSPKKINQSSKNLSENQIDTHSEHSTLLLTVEQWTLKYYTNKLNFERGIHTESRVYHLLFIVLFYDILYETTQLNDVFYSLRQTAPLDLFTDEFYQSRQESIDIRLEWILNAIKSSNKNPEPLSVEQTIKLCWDHHYGERCLWADWDLFTSADELCDIFWCLGPKIVHTICKKLATDCRSWRSGLPDLLVWTPSELRSKIIEVKGPGDHLSTQQIMWLDVLVNAGADVEICHVSAIPMKSLSMNK